MKHIKLFEAFAASQKVNEASDCGTAQAEKWAPICKLLKCDYYDLVFFELIHDEMGVYTEEEYTYAREKDEAQSFTPKKFKLDAINDEDPHGRCEASVSVIKGTKLKYAWFEAPDMSYFGTIASSKDLQALEDFYLDGKEASTKNAVKYPVEMSDVYGEYCTDMGFAE